MKFNRNFMADEVVSSVTVFQKFVYATIIRGTG